MIARFIRCTTLGLGLSLIQGTHGSAWASENKGEEAAPPVQQAEYLASRSVVGMKTSGVGVLLFIPKIVKNDVTKRLGKPHPRGEFETEEEYRGRRSAHRRKVRATIESTLQHESKTAYRVRIEGRLGDYDLESKCFSDLVAISSNVYQPMMTIEMRKGVTDKLPTIKAASGSGHSTVEWSWSHRYDMRNDVMKYYLHLKATYLYKHNLCVPVDEAKKLRHAGKPVVAVVTLYSMGDGVFDISSVQWEGVGGLAK